jgi:GxxExxY protein
MEVHTTLGPGFLESIYSKALLRELGLRNIETKTEVEINVSYKAGLVGRHRIDLLIRDAVVVELKAVSSINSLHLAQVISYLKATNLEVGLILNFGEERLSWKRVIRKPRM